MQAVDHAHLLCADPSKGFLVGGISSGGRLAAVLAHRALHDPFFADNPLTGQLLGTPSILRHPDIPEQYVPSRTQLAGIKVLNRSLQIQVGALLARTEQRRPVLNHQDARRADR